MDCLHSLAPSDEELLGYVLDQEPLPARAREHVEQCSSCQRRLAQYKQTNAFLLSQLYRKQCPSATKLNYYCATMLPADEVMSITRHVQACPLCAAEVVDIRRVLANFDPFPEPVYSLRASHGTLRRIIASLVPGQPRLVTRGDTSETVWPRYYRAESIDLSLHLSRASNGEIMLLGIMSSVDPAEDVGAFEGVVAELYTAPGPLTASSERNGSNGHGVTSLLSTQVDDLGNMVFKGIPAGEYVMVVRLPGREVVIEGLKIGHG